MEQPPAPAHRLAKALRARDVLHVHEGVGEEALEGDALLRVPLQQLSQEIPAFQRELGPAGKLGKEGTKPSDHCGNPPSSIPPVTCTARSLRIFSSSSAKEWEAKGGFPKSASVEGKGAVGGRWRGGTSPEQSLPGQ